GHPCRQKKIRKTKNYVILSPSLCSRINSAKNLLGCHCESAEGGRGNLNFSIQNSLFDITHYHFDRSDAQHREAEKSTNAV
ncbi:MAG: hypothetical protein JSW07_07295, partial [bacterium]